MVPNCFHPCLNLRTCIHTQKTQADIKLASFNSFLFNGFSIVQTLGFYITLQNLDMYVYIGAPIGWGIEILAFEILAQPYFPDQSIEKLLALLKAQMCVTIFSEEVNYSSLFVDTGSCAHQLSMIFQHVHKIKLLHYNKD